MSIVVLRNQNTAQRMGLNTVGDHDIALDLRRDTRRIGACKYRGVNGESDEDPLVDHLERDLSHVHGVSPRPSLRAGEQC